ncbi:UDP-N-acetylmuramate dehydrogenase [Vibrio cholerae]
MPETIQTHANLACHHTFAIAQTCEVLIEAHTQQDIIDVYQNRAYAALPKLMLGKGSNMLFTAPYQGVVIVNHLLGKTVQESDTHWHLHIEAGEDWPSLVKWCVESGYYGLENLALIPGCAGSAPIQNIGAYGVELQDVCEYVDVLCLESFEVRRMHAQECQFGYRDSIFKRDLYQKVVIVALGLKLAKAWQPNITYGPLQGFARESVTAQEIFDTVCRVRQEKLPDPRVQGNAGSFFKNPVVSQSEYERLSAAFPTLVAYPAGDAASEGAMKLAAGWLIDQCGLKGHRIGGAQVHPNQALVIVNTGNASADDVLTLAATVRAKVQSTFGVPLEHEVRFMGPQGETRLETLLEEGRVTAAKSSIDSAVQGEMR